LFWKAADRVLERCDAGSENETALFFNSSKNRGHLSDPTRTESDIKETMLTWISGKLNNGS
jgi:hypothetical protein